MSDIIHLLPDSVANQIAAGEVITRPASLIKDLVENSLDAGATRIQVIVTDAGKTCVQVIDNGKGMSETDARLSFERHATSKIQQANDLFSLTTMGFRGEALASIAAVAQVELRTRLEGEELGVSINIEGSRVTSQEPIVCPVGANFIVKNLFFNIPARRKFLKSNHTELNNIITEFDRIVLAHPDTAFTLSTPDAVLLDLPAGTLRQRIVNVFGKAIDKHLLTVQVDTPVVKVSGFVGNPESSKKKGAQQFFFVNGRFMRHPYFAKAVQTAYERLISEGEMVPFFLSLQVDPAKIDVNIHPTKTEIKFEDEQTIWQILLAGIREALGKFSAIPTIDFDRENCPDIPVFTAENPNDVKVPGININPAFNPFETGNTNRPTEDVFSVPKTTSSGRAGSDIHRNTPQLPPYNIVEELYGPTQAKEEKPQSPFSFVEEGKTAASSLFDHLDSQERQEWEAASAEYLQYKGRYLLTPVESGLLLIDFTRAHTRVLFDEYLKKARDHQMDSQGLLFPQILDLTPSHAALLESMMDDILALGFDLSPLGNGSFSILRVPSGIEGMDPTALLTSMVDDAIEKSVEVRDEMLNILALTLARRTSIPVGQLLTQEEMKDLASRLFASSNPNYTPDGKVITTILPHAAIISKFGG